MYPEIQNALRDKHSVRRQLLGERFRVPAQRIKMETVLEKYERYIEMNKTVLIKGAGDLASGIAVRLAHCGFSVVMTETKIPTTVRRTVAFSPAVYLGEAQVEDVTGVLCGRIEEEDQMEELQTVLAKGQIAVVVDERAEILEQLHPDVVVDAILAKKNLGTRITDAPLVIGVGPGFTAGEDCHCVVETKRGHYIGRCIWEGSAIPNTGVPGNIGGYTVERIIRASEDGVFEGCVEIGDRVEAGTVVGYCISQNVKTQAETETPAKETVPVKTPVYAQISGVVRGLLQDGVPVTKGMKSGDVDPRCEVEHCFTVSDKARAIGGGVLEAILAYQSQAQDISRMI